MVLSGNGFHSLPSQFALLRASVMCVRGCRSLFPAHASVSSPASVVTADETGISQVCRREQFRDLGKDNPN